MTYTRVFSEIRKDDLALAGGKGANLGELTHAGLPVPPGFVVTTDAYDAFVAANDLQPRIVDLASGLQGDDAAAFERTAVDIRSLFEEGEIPEDVAEEIRIAYDDLAGNGHAVAVRSSATAEDLPGASFAGQQETFLNVRTREALLAAVIDCWASLWTARAMAYRGREGIAPEDVRLAVVVQELVPADAAGIAFSADPQSGQRDRVVINAAWGLGEAVVGGEVTPDTLTVEKESGRVIDRETSEKGVMTVRTDAGTEAQSVPTGKRREPVLSDAQATELAEYALRIEEHYGAAQDIEWTLSDSEASDGASNEAAEPRSGEFAIVQARPITALPDPVGKVPTDWSVSDSRTYVRGSIIEQLPDPLSPLFADLSTEPVPETLNELLNELLGTDLSEGDVRFPTINGYAYLQMELGRVMWSLLRQPIRFTELIIDMIGRGIGVTMLAERFRPRYAATVERWEEKSLEEVPTNDLLAGAEELFTDGVRYYTGVQLVMPPAMISESSFTSVYDRLIRRDGDPPAQTYLLGFDSVPLQAEKSLYDLSTWSRDRLALVDALLAADPAEASALLDTETPPGAVSEAVWSEWRERFGEHLDHYGHLLYNLDFVNPVPADDPEPVFRTLTQYLGDQGRNPHERQRGAITRRETLTDETLSRLSWSRRELFRRSLRWAQTYVPEREDALADLGLGWPRLRELLGELGARFVESGVIEAADDVYWLQREEVERAIAAVERGDSAASLNETVRNRKTQWRGRKRATPPQVLPTESWMTSMEAILPAEEGVETGDIEGVAASAGSVTATARVIDGPENFEDLEPGDVLVARITTPAWTPLFALAAAVVTDVGGPLSHGSIVAREYEIPAVLGTGNATSRIESGQEITVDGDAGIVRLVRADTPNGDREEPSSETPSTESAADEPSSKGSAGRVLLAVGVTLGLLAWWRRRRGSPEQ